MNREALLEPIIRLARRGTSLSRFDVLKSLENWDVTPLAINDEHIGTVINNGPEIHMAFVEDWRPTFSTRGMIHGVIAPLLEQHSFLTTRVKHEHRHQQQFVQRMGFMPTWKDDLFSYYMLTKLPFERKAA